MPRVSIVIPAYNHAAYIAESIDSVLRQTYTNFEIVVVNDGSPDATEEALKPYIDRQQIIYIKQPNGGQAKARNRGIQACQGEFVALLDDDDCWAPNKLEWQVAQMDLYQRAVAVAGEHRLDMAGLMQDYSSPLSEPNVATFETLFLGNPLYSPGQALIRRSALLAIGGFQENIWGADDWDIYLKLSRVGEIHIYLRPSLFYRQHSGNASRHMARLLLNVHKVLHSQLLQLPPEKQPPLREHAMRWIYRFGFRNLVHQMNEQRHRREFGAWTKGAGETLRRLHAIRYNRLVAGRLARDFVRTKIDWSW